MRLSKSYVQYDKDNEALSVVYKIKGHLSFGGKTIRKMNSKKNIWQRDARKRVALYHREMVQICKTAVTLEEYKTVKVCFSLYVCERERDGERG